MRCFIFVIVLAALLVLANGHPFEDRDGRDLAGLLGLKLAAADRTFHGHHSLLGGQSPFLGGMHGHGAGLHGLRHDMGHGHGLHGLHGFQGHHAHGLGHLGHHGHHGFLH